LYNIKPPKTNGSKQQHSVQKLHGKNNTQYNNNNNLINGNKSDGGDEQSDFKTTTLRFTNNNFTIDGGDLINRFHEVERGVNNRGLSPHQRLPPEYTDMNYS